MRLEGHNDKLDSHMSFIVKIITLIFNYAFSN